jgi:WD40 repeat protein
LLAFSPDSSRLLTATQFDKYAVTCRLWDIAGGEPVGPPLAQKEPVHVVAFSRDGSLALAGGKGSARLWHAATGQAAGRALEHKPGEHVCGAFFHANGRDVVTNAFASAKDKGSINHWRIDTRERTAGPFPTEQNTGDCAFQRDGARLLTTLSFKARLWDVATGSAVGPTLEHEGMVHAVTFTPDGRRALTASGEFAARVWYTATGLQVAAPLQHHDGVWRVAVSPDGQTALTGSLDRTAKLWRLSAPPARVLNHEKDVYSVLFSLDGRSLWTACMADRDSVRSWDLRTGLPRQRAFSMPKGCRALALSEDGEVLAAASENLSLRWHPDSGLKIEPDLVAKKVVFVQAFSPDKTRLAAGGQDRVVQVWDTVANNLLYPPLKHDGEVRAVNFSPDGLLLMSASDDRTVRFWDAATGAPKGERVYNGAVLAAVFSPDGKSYVTGGNDRIARQWDTATGAPVGPPLSHEDIVLSVAFSHDGRHILTGSTRSARLWDVATGKTLGPPIRHRGNVWSVAISPDGNTLSTGSWDGTVQLVDTPQPVDGTTADVVRWVQVITGHELDADGSLRVLQASDWRERKAKLR